MTGGDQAGDEAKRLGYDLGQLRRSKGVSGAELARRTGMSQSTISRIETGQKTPIPEDVELIVAALKEPVDSVRQFRQRAEALFGQGIEDPASAVGRFQPRYRDYEQRASRIRVFQPTIVPGLLQTSEYARGVVSQYSVLFRNTDPTKVAEAVAERIARQGMLDDLEKSFVFLLTESVLEYPTVPALDMASQLSALKRAAERPNVELLLIPAGRTLPYPAMNGFHLFDDTRVLTETVTTVVRSDTEADLALYATLFEAYAALAASDGEAILARHQERWTALAV
ncbi:MAG: helix-turn-helix domain-containing protein [Frankia sp.]